MPFLAPTFCIAAVLALSTVCSARNTSPETCVAFSEASQHLGTTQCVRGTVLHVEDGKGGAKLLTFCDSKDKEKDKACSFYVVVFPADLKKMGDIRQLEGRQIEIKGTVQDYDGHAEIILRRSQQLGESAFRLFPPVPTDYDVERQGHNSAGKYSRPKTKTTTTKQSQPVSIEDPEEPQ
jgi:DNA/RNA endonuclease YhcR with UshA esterase domain